MTTPVFDHRDTGRSDTDWLRSPNWARARPVQLAPGIGIRGLIVLAAHPDDESLGAGGAMATAASAGIPVTVLLATDGEGSHPRSATHSPSRLAAMRVAEVRSAVDRVAPQASIVRLRLPDGRLAEHDTELDAALDEQIGPLGAGGVLLAPWRHDGHTDHDAAGRAAARCAERSGAVLGEYPVWAWHWAQDDDLPWDRLRTLALDQRVVTAKRAALREHRTQIEALSAQPGDEVLLGPHLLAHFERSFETFVDAAGTWDESVFERLHRSADDPWSVTTSEYERRKRRRTLDALPAARFARAFEPGCSVGELTAALSERCDEVLAVDVSPTAVRRARARTEDSPTVRIEQRGVPEWWPDGSFDLIVLSEMCYFLQPDTLRRLLSRTRDSLRPGGWVLLCDWRHPIDGWVLDASTVHRTAYEILDLPIAFSDSDDDVMLELFGPMPEPSGGRR